MLLPAGAVCADGVLGVVAVEVWAGASAAVPSRKAPDRAA